MSSILVVVMNNIYNVVKHPTTLKSNFINSDIQPQALQKNDVHTNPLPNGTK